MNVKRGKKVRGTESKRGREGTRDRAIYGSLCHSGFILAARFDGGQRRESTEALGANNTSL